jgi:hypothetical protein
VRGISLKEEKQVVNMTCDNCRTKVSDDGEKRYGGSVFSGWFHVEHVCGSTAISLLQKQNTFDFCSAKCLEEFALTFQMPKEQSLPND